MTSQAVYLGNSVPSGGPFNLWLDGISKGILISPNRHIAVRAQIIIVNAVTDETAYFEAHAAFKNSGGGPQFVGVPTIIEWASDNPSQYQVDLGFSGSTNEITLKVTDTLNGGSNSACRATAFIRYTEIDV